MLDCEICLKLTFSFRFIFLFTFPNCGWWLGKPIERPEWTASEKSARLFSFEIVWKGGQMSKLGYMQNSWENTASCQNSFYDTFRNLLDDICLWWYLWTTILSLKRYSRKLLDNFYGIFCWMLWDIFDILEYLGYYGILWEFWMILWENSKCFREIV